MKQDATKGMTGWSSSWSSALNIVYSDFDFMRTAKKLAGMGCYRESLIIIRTVFEYYFLLLLMAKGKRYRDTRIFHITPISSKTVREARDATYERWVGDWKSGKAEYQEFIAIDKGSEEDVIRVTFETKGLYEEKDKKKEGDFIPIFFFAFDEYDPEAHFLAGLPTLYGHGSEYANIVERHKHLYSHFLNIRKIATNLRLNNLLSEEQLDRFWVHYNYLSYFVHPTRRGLLGMDGFQYVIEKTTKRDSVMEALVLRYLAHFQIMHLRLLVEYFSEKNTLADFAKYTNQTEKLQALTNDFWFIYNEPTLTDLKLSEVRKGWMEMQGLPVPGGTVYYSDPYERLKHELAYGTT